MPPRSFNPYLRGGDRPYIHDGMSQESDDDNMERPIDVDGGLPGVPSAGVVTARRAFAARAARYQRRVGGRASAGLGGQSPFIDVNDNYDYGYGGDDDDDDDDGRPRGRIRLPEDREKGLPFNVIVPDRLKFEKRHQLFTDSLKPDPLDGGRSKIVPEGWEHIYEIWGVGDRHIHVMERLGIDESLLRAKEPNGEVERKRRRRRRAAAESAAAGGAPPPEAWWKFWQREPVKLWKDLGFTTWVSRSGFAEERRGISGDLGQEDGWVPLRLGFDREWSTEDEEEDVWFQMLYMHLFVRIVSFVDKYFDHGDIDPSTYAGNFIWLEDFPKEFLWYVKKVARQDNNFGGWDALLTINSLRRCLVVAVIAKVLETWVFDDLFFGAEDDQILMLETQDRGLLASEGYRRTDIRARTVRAALQDQTLTPMFWPCVDHLSVQLTALLSPLLRVMDKHFPASNENSLRSFHQDIHAIVSEAGYFSIARSWSSDIFRFSTPFLGQSWDLDQAHFDDGPWKLSKAMADTKYQVDLEMYQRAKEEAEKAIAAQESVQNEIVNDRAKRRAESIDLARNLEALGAAVERERAGLLAAINGEGAARAAAEAAERARDERREVEGLDGGADGNGQARQLSDAATKARQDYEQLRAGGKRHRTALAAALRAEDAAINAIDIIEERFLARSRVQVREHNAAIQMAKLRMERPNMKAGRRRDDLEREIAVEQRALRRAEFDYAAAKLKAEERAKRAAEERVQAGREADYQAAEAAAARRWPRFLSWLPGRMPWYSTPLPKVVTLPPPPTPESRLAKVQICLWPMLQRYSPVGPIEKEGAVAPEGETIVRLSKAQVIYYAGFPQTGMEGLEANPTLDAWIKSKRRQRLRSWLVPLLWALLVLSIWQALHWVGRNWFPPLESALNWLEGRTLHAIRGFIVNGVVFAMNTALKGLQVLLTLAKLFVWLVYAIRNFVIKLFGGSPTGPSTGLNFAPGGWRLPELDWNGAKFGRIGTGVFQVPAWAGGRQIEYPLYGRTDPALAEGIRRWLPDIRWQWPAPPQLAASGDWEFTGLPYPEFSRDSFRRMWQALVGELVWRTYHIDITLRYPTYGSAPATGLDF